MGNGNSSGRRRNMSRLWYLDENGKLQVSPVFLGLTDGKNTEIVRGRDIKEGMKIITGVVEDDAASTNSSNLFNPAQPSRRDMFRRGF